MTIVFIILKWIGILLAAILLLFLFLCLLVLFAPVRYTAHVIYQDELKYGYRLRWCIHLLSIQKKVDSNRVRLYLFGIPIRTIAGEDEVEETVKHDIKTGLKKVEEPLERENEPEKQGLRQGKPDNDMSKPEKRKVQNRSSKKKKKKKKSPIEKLHFHFIKISSIIKFIRDRKNKKVFSMLWKEWICLLRYVSPGVVRGKVCFGTGDPSSTGLILGGISLFPWAYSKDLVISPDFEESMLKGELTAKGRIRICYIAGLAWRLYRSRELKRTINEWKNI